MSNASHLKEILVYLKPNNFPRYLEQLTDIESRINNVDATKYQHDMNMNRPVVKEQEQEQEQDNNGEKEENAEETTNSNHEEENVVMVEEQEEVSKEEEESEKEKTEMKVEQENQDGMDNENYTTQSLGPSQPEVLEE